MELFTIGFPTAFSLGNLFYCFLGVFLGTLIGVLPGIGPLATISLLLPVTMYLEPTTALVMLAGVYYGAQYGGSTTAILLNLPGEAGSAVTCLDGYPMRQQGRAGPALFITAAASFVGGSIGIIVLMAFAPSIVQMARMFGAAEYFAAMLLALVMASSIAQGSALKGYIMMTLGLVLGSIGIDVNSGVPRFDMGFHQLYEGVSLVIIAMGLFGITEIIDSLRKENQNSVGQVERIKLRTLLPTSSEVRQMTVPTLRGTAIGIVSGILPGVAANVASFISYAVEKRVARDPSMFGKGAVAGIAAPEASTNAAVQAAFIPTLLLGIPGSATMAVMLGALMIHGVTIGPALMTRTPDLFWGLIASFWIGNVMLVILNVPMIGLWVSLLRIPYNLLYPGIVALICVGTYSLRYNVFDVWMVLLFGAVGYGMRLLKFEPAPLLIGFILGPMIEENFRRAMLFAYGDFTNVLQRPLAATLLAATVLVIAANVLPPLLRMRRSKSASHD